MTRSYLDRFGYVPAFPTPYHQAAVESVVDRLAGDERVQAVLLTGSCARGKAVPASCVDITLLVSPEDCAWYKATIWPDVQAFVEQDTACRALAEHVRWSAVDLDLRDGTFPTPYHGWTSGADNYELEIGNVLAWTHPLLQRGPRYHELCAQYLPFYDDAQRAERLRMVLGYAANNLDHVDPFVARGLLFQAHKRLYHATEEYLQALFIHRRLYPIAYDKWVREQLVDILQEPDIYDALNAVVAVDGRCVGDLSARAARLRPLLEALLFAA